MEKTEFCRESSENLDNILGKKYDVLSDGFIRVVDYVGNDNSILMAARVSYGKGTKTVSSDKALINYLMAHHHWTPFEMPTIIFHVRVPMDVWRQWIRHRAGSFNEYSTRYSEAIDSMNKTKSSEWRIQSSNNKQGSDGFIDPKIGYRLTYEEKKIHEQLKRTYEDRLALGVAKEQARKDLPLSNYTEAYWKVDLRNLLNFLNLRTDLHAQKEIRDYANIILHKILPLWVPYSYEAFLNYIKESISLSKEEQQIVAAIIQKDQKLLTYLLGLYDYASYNDDGTINKLKRKYSELENKLKILKIKIPLSF